MSAKIEVKKAKRDVREAELGSKIVALPDRRYGVILADPEWQFEPYSKETGMDRAADNHYPTSSLDVIKARDVASIPAEIACCSCGRQCPCSSLPNWSCKAWGFEYRSNCVWGKDRAGTGYWFRNQHEQLLIGTKGNIPCPALRTQWNSWVMAPVGRHSEKPAIFHEMIEAYFPNLPKIELNCRGAPRPGWDAWGNEAIAAE